MCGIAGWTDFSKILLDETDVIKNMTDTLARRGPDDAGCWLSEHALLGHRRLTVVDPVGGKQPMTLLAGGHTYVIVYNGELYNTEELRLALKEKGHTFEGWSDTEVLLHAYAAWGDACLERLNGIFAFAVWDGQKKCLFLARDRIGVKPLFYARRGKGLIFASELKALLKHPEIEPVIDTSGLAEIFALGPARTPGSGVFKDVSELRPGCCLVFNKNGEKSRPYWTLQSHEHPDDFDKTVRTVRELVVDTVHRQLVSDVPLCVLLSGGLDSSAIASVAATYYKKERNERLRTFSIDYVDNDKNFRPSDFQPNDDAPWVRRVADFLETTHENCFLDTPELADALFPAVMARDLPGMADIDSSLLLFSRWVKNRATVGLSGECADEVFGGYPWFTRHADAGTFPWSQHLESRVKMFSPALVDSIRPQEYVAARYEEACCEVPRFGGDSTDENHMRELFYLNLTRWMPTLLDRKDRMSMYSGLELRVPFCDHRIVEYVWNIPWSMKYYKEREKGLLRQAMTGLLPDDVLWRKKSPYPKTHNPNYIETLRRLTLKMLDDTASPIRPLIELETVRTLAQTLDRETNIPWFGQLMNAPQLLAYLLQVDYWMRMYAVRVE
ncbi:asparagine synthase (glutamine-hydrolyzing) [Oscillospiraceae bacterium CM]|nr:asparagine synthase (glutamine-hydrolyzing) [Oscillospiraceae bacterium CM]